MNKEISHCEVCNKPVPDYKEEYCCGGYDCYCMGMPTEPCICSNECWDVFTDMTDMPLEECRIKAGIKKWKKGDEE